MHRRLTLHAGAPRWARVVSLLVVAGGLVLFALANVAYRSLDPEPWRPVIVVGLTWLAVAWYLTLGCALVAVPALVLRLLGRAAARRRWLRIGTLAVVVGTAAVTAYGAVVAARPGVVAYDVEVAGLPQGWDGTRVVLVTDLHVGAVRGEGWTRRMVDLVAAQDPELVVLAGDLVDGREVHTGPLLAPLAELDAPLGAFAVSGNHEVESGDGEAYLDRFEDVGLTVLRNKAVRVARGGDEVVVAGVHDAIGTGALAPDAGAALAQVEAEDLVIFVAHQPRQVPGDGRVDLQLSGHTHGGQIWPFGWLVPLQQPTLAGVEEVDGVTVVTSRGFGTSGPPVRVGSAPEIVVLTLRAGDLDGHGRG